MTKTAQTKKRKSTKGGVGSSFSEYLSEQGTLNETTSTAIKRVIAFQLATAMEAEHISKSELALKMETSRSQLNRILDPDNDGVTLQALANAAKAIGRELCVELK